MSEFEKQIKLDNLSEHLKTVKVNIEVASRELDDTLSKKNEAERILQELTADAEVLRGEISVLQEVKKDVEKDISERYIELDGIEKQIVDEGTELKNVKHERNLAQSAFNALNNQLDAIKSDIDEAENKKSSVEARNLDLKHELVSLTAGITQAYIAIDEMSAEKKEEREEKEREIERLKSEIEKLRAIKEEEDARIVEADVYIKNKENDIAVIKRRLQSLYDEIRPGVALSI